MVGRTLRAYGSNTNLQPAVEAARRQRQADKSTSWLRRQLRPRKIALVFALLVLGVGLWLGGKFAYNAHKLFGGSLFSALTTSKLKGEDTGRVNILLAGNSADDQGHDGAELTDSIMLISINTKDKSALMMSIPRDLYINLGNNNYSKINYAYIYGKQKNFNQSGYPSGGMGKLEQIVEQNFGIKIDYYALVNYKAFRDAVNAVGGIDFTVKSPDPRGLYDPNIDYTTGGPLVKLSNGPHHLNGQQALNLARARGDSYRAYGFPQSDFDRATHQRQMLMALKAKVASAGVLANPARLSSLSDAIGNNVKTDLQIGEIRRLYDLTKGINNNAITSISLNNANGKNLLQNYRTHDGQAALVPSAGIDNYSEIKAFIRKQMSGSPVAREGASLVVLNGTNVLGLASKVRDLLTQQGFGVGAIGDAAASQAQLANTVIIDTSGGGMPATLEALKKKYPNASITTKNPYAHIYNTDIIVVLGADAAASVNSASSSSGPKGQ